MTVFKTIFDQINSNPDNEFLIDVRGDQLIAMKGSELVDKVARARQSLQDTGVQAGDRVGLLAPNSQLWGAADLAIIAEKGVVVPLYSRQEPKELAEMLDDCGARVILCADKDLLEALSKAWTETFPDKEALELLSFDTLFSAKATTKEIQQLEPQDLVTIIYTSGTSGKPKGVMLSASNIDFMIPQTVSALGELYGQQAEERVFHYLPLCFAGSRIMLWTQLYRGKAIMLSTDLNNLIQELGVAKPNYFLNVPMLLERIRRGVRDKIRGRGFFPFKAYQAGIAAAMRKRAGTPKLLDGVRLGIGRRLFKKIRAQVGSSWHFLICGSAPLSEETQAWFELMEIPVYQVYGLTETTAIVTMDKPDKVEAGKVGHAVEGLEMKLSEEGELLIKGPNIFQGYWGMPEKTEEAIKDGWFYTGDLAEVDDSGNWKIVGRAKNVLVPESGHNVAPEPLEQRLLEACEQLQQAVVIGHGRRYLTCIVTGQASHEQIQGALENVNGDLPHYRQIRKFFHSPEELTYEKELLTANQKLRRKAIEDYFSKAIEEMYAV